MSIKEVIKLIDFYIQSAIVKSPLQVELIQDLKCKFYKFYNCIEKFLYCIDKYLTCIIKKYIL